MMGFLCQVTKGIGKMDKEGITKISDTGKILWNKLIGNPIGGENQFWD